MCTLVYNDSIGKELAGFEKTEKEIQDKFAQTEKEYQQNLLDHKRRVQLLETVPDTSKTRFVVFLPHAPLPLAPFFLR